MAEEEQYVTLENYRKGVEAAKQQGIIIGMLRALSDLHQEEPEIKNWLITMRKSLGDDVR